LVPSAPLTTSVLPSTAMISKLLVSELVVVCADDGTATPSRHTPTAAMIRLTSYRMTPPFSYAWSPTPMRRAAAHTPRLRAGRWRFPPARMNPIRVTALRRFALLRDGPDDVALRRRADEVKRITRDERHRARRRRIEHGDVLRIDDPR